MSRIYKKSPARNILLQAVNLALGGNTLVYSWIDIADLCTLGI